MLGHRVVADPEELGALAARSAGRTPFAVCVSASCFVDSAWTRRRLGATRAAGPVFVLIDVDKALDHHARHLVDLRTKDNS